MTLVARTCSCESALRGILAPCPVHGTLGKAKWDRLTKIAREAVRTLPTMHNPDHDEPFAAFVQAMADELRANADKGDRAGWLSAGAPVMVSEVLYHAGKLALAVREVIGGRPPDPRTAGFSPDDIREYAADVANCALMVADCAGVLATERPQDAPRSAAA